MEWVTLKRNGRKYAVVFTTRSLNGRGTDLFIRSQDQTEKFMVKSSDTKPTTTPPIAHLVAGRHLEKTQQR